MPANRIGAVVLLVLGTGLAALTGCGPGAPKDFGQVDFTPDETRTGPVGEQFNSDSFAIVRVLRQPKQLSAFGYAVLYDDSREVGRMDEGQKQLPSNLQGERLIFSWDYKGEPGASAAARIELGRQRDPKLVVLTEEYTDLQRGRYRIAYNNRGAEFKRGGAVVQWRIQIIADGTVVAQKQSSLWSAMTAGEPASQ
jgi:hypothetical protein